MTLHHLITRSYLLSRLQNVMHGYTKPKNSLSFLFSYTKLFNSAIQKLHADDATSSDDSDTDFDPV